ncbi:hypothetical protein [Roseibium litorale]|uniref:Uncharacterized protein n=1 Tax=Roseibium litorale TaxID=2803841 RepID=A0ABR9CSS2_9HYPH|nr:hypothetical protein [Roseibium litorale]MBD8893337.1 hypothetical protein [Roseibium litorale]
MLDVAIAGGGLTGHSSGNAAYLAQFSAWGQARSDHAFDSDRQNLKECLSEQDRYQLTPRPVLETVEATLDEALVFLGQLDLDMAGIAVENGGSALMLETQAPFRSFLHTLTDDVIAFNRTCCALSNVPYEHKLSNDYKQRILRGVAAGWREFSLAASRLLLSRAEARGLDLSGSHSFGELS